MCDLFSFAAGGLTGTVGVLDILGVGATLLSVSAISQQSNASQGQAEYQAAVTRNNQIVANQMAEDATERGQVAEEDQRRRTKQIIGSQRAGLAGTGVAIDPDSSAVDLLSDTAQFGELDALTIRNNAAREAYTYRAQAGNLGAEAGLLDARARAEADSRPLLVGGTLLSGATSIADRWYTRNYYGGSKSKYA